VAIEAATYHRIRSAVSAAHKEGTATTFSGSTELSLPAAAEYANNYLALEGIHDVRVSVGVGSLEIGPPSSAPAEEKAPADRRRGTDRRSGADRRKRPRTGESRRDA
jgi:hypothetical protein